MAERQRNMIEQERITAKQIKERNMAEQIKDFLDKGIPKADIAKATKFSLEYIDSLLEKFYPQTAGTEQTSDIESQLNFLKHKYKFYKINLTTRNLKMYN